MLLTKSSILSTLITSAIDWFDSSSLCFFVLGLKWVVNMLFILFLQTLSPQRNWGLIASEQSSHSFSLSAQCYMLFGWLAWTTQPIWDEICILNLVMFCPNFQLEVHLLLVFSANLTTITHLLELPVRKQVCVCFYIWFDALITCNCERWSLWLQESSFILWLCGWLEVRLCWQWECIKNTWLCRYSGHVCRDSAIIFAIEFINMRVKQHKGRVCSQWGHFDRFHLDVTTLLCFSTWCSNRCILSALIHTPKWAMPLVF